jgi:lysophospholipase L1-like esterase
MLESSVRLLQGRPSSRGLRGRGRRWVAALACCVASAAPSAARAIDDTLPDRGESREAVLVGSSSFNQAFGVIIERQLERWGYLVTRKGVGSAGLARPDFRDMNQVLDSLPISARTDAVFVYLGVNDAQSLWLHPGERATSSAPMVPFGTPTWEARYAERTLGFYERICQRGAKRAIVLLPVDVNRSELQRRLHRIRELQVQAASRSSCATVLSTAGDAGQFEVGGVAKRLPDGFHLSPFGASVVWDRVRGHVLGLLSLSARPGLSPGDGMYAGRVTPFL